MQAGAFDAAAEVPPPARREAHKTRKKEILYVENIQDHVD